MAGSPRCGGGGQSTRRSRGRSSGDVIQRGDDRLGQAYGRVEVGSASEWYRRRAAARRGVRGTGSRGRRRRCRRGVRRGRRRVGLGWRRRGRGATATRGFPQLAHRDWRRVCSLCGRERAASQDARDRPIPFIAHRAKALLTLRSYFPDACLVKPAQLTFVLQEDPTPV